MTEEAEPRISRGKITIHPNLNSYMQTMARRSKICSSCPEKGVCDPSSMAQPFKGGEVEVVVRGKLAGTENCVLPFFALRTDARFMTSVLTKMAFPQGVGHWASVRSKIDQIEIGKRKATPKDLNNLAAQIAERLGQPVEEVYGQFSALKSDRAIPLDTWNV